MPTAENVLWSVLSVVLLVAGVGAFIWSWSFGRKYGEEDFKPLARDPLAALALTRTWHLQSALLWIAIAFLAAGLFPASVINGDRDPEYQKLGVDLLFGALVVAVASSRPRREAKMGRPWR